MSDANATSRLAGALYLVVVLTGLFSLMYVPSKIGASGDLQDTVRDILGAEPLFRAGIAAFLLKQIAFLLLPLALYRLLRPVSHSAAVLMVALAVVSVPIALVSLAHRLDALDILTGSYGPALAADALQAQAILALGAYRHGLLVTTLFWGLWLLPFGYLVIRSGFLPKLLGVFLILGGLAYVTQVFGQILLPDRSLPGWVMLPAAVGEIGICLWLLLVGVRTGR
ncbi:DUF4386 domain-containing protein [Stagnimonas aquatica]|uniref:DUF4386 domain-containing protein n=1 Tax=Stagnimonas aquatica TaxID=2689987 RepID=A0A3N0VGJ0_9GAMM|nr:DUF4386 domain-containing protein [Stagnimonas aquatica]ROH91866.1 DUF4386 domain-containing protein [Stagnimonas aquatica]